MKIYVYNHLNKGQAIEFCCGIEEYSLENGEWVAVEVRDEDCIYLDVTRPKDD